MVQAHISSAFAQSSHSQHFVCVVCEAVAGGIPGRTPAAQLSSVHSAELDQTVQFGSKQQAATVLRQRDVRAYDGWLEAERGSTKAEALLLLRRGHWKEIEHYIARRQIIN